MIAKEAHTSPSVKGLIVAASGVDDFKWEGTYAKPTGGILTVLSELIHKVATRGVKVWKDFDESVLKLPKEKRAAWLAGRREEITRKPNADFSKPWFGWKKGGTVTADLSGMTYEEVTLRMIRLMFVSHEGRSSWIDLSLRNLTGDWIRRVEERFAGVNGTGSKPSLLQSFKSLDDPTSFLEKFFAEYPSATEQLLASEDKAYFLTIAQRPGQKPVPFIPVLDANFEVWFKKVRSQTTSSCFSSYRFGRTLSGLQKILRPSSIKTRSEFASCKARLLPNIPKSRTSPSKIFLATSTRLSLEKSSSASTAVACKMSPLSVTLEIPQQVFPEYLSACNTTTPR